MSELREFMRSVEGTDDMGMKKAACCLTIQGNGSEQGVEAVASVCTLRAALAMYLTDSWVVIDLEFEDDTDPDLVRMMEVCRGYDERMHERCGTICEGESLVVSVTQLGDYESFLVGIDGAWGLRPAETERGCSVIRFIFEREKTGVYELDEAEMEGMIAEVEEEILFKDE